MVPPGPDVLGHQPRQRPFQLVGRHRLRHVRDTLDTIAQQPDIAPSEGEQDVDDGRLLDRVEATDRAEVDEAERAVVEHEDVAGVRVTVEEAEAHDLIERRAHQLVGESLAIDTIGIEACRVAHRSSLEPLLHEDPASAQVPLERRHAHRRNAVETHGHLGHCVCFVAEVELLPQPLRELGEHVAGPQSATERRSPLGEVGEQSEARPGRAPWSPRCPVAEP